MKPILLLVDRPNWAFDFSAKSLKQYLGREFNFQIKYVIDNPLINPDEFAAIYVYFWGETFYRQFFRKTSKCKIVKQISSFRWRDDPRYGPCTPAQMSSTYLADASIVTCTSDSLFQLFKKRVKTILRVRNGIDPQIFKFKKFRQGDLTVGWAGNIKDPVKGVSDILLPAIEISQTKLKLADGSLSRSNMVKFFQQLDVFAVTSRHEAEPLTLLEAMACGCFPVTTRVGIVPELVHHRRNGLIITDRSPTAFAHAFIWCQNHLETIREAASRQSQQLLSARSWPAVISDFRQVFNQVYV